MKAIIKYSRNGAAKYLSHLDMQRAFARALRRANIDVQYSMGYNPHIVMSFASPLSVGYATRGDYLEVALNSGREELIAKALNDVFPEDIRVLSVHIVEKQQKKLMAMNYCAEYEIAFSFQNDTEYVKLNKVTSTIWQQEHYNTLDRKGREVDIRPLILSLEVKENIVSTMLQNTSSGALNPAVLANAILGELGMNPEEEDYTICRVDCYTNFEGSIVSFGTLALERNPVP